MALKIDLEKAYDKLEWSFVRCMLKRFNFPNILIEIIMSCITTITTSILFNGGSLEPFEPTREIRQGDPLSPYIFIMRMDFLSQLIQEKCEARLWKPVKSSRSEPSFSHLFFADDLVLFAKATPENCEIVKEVLDMFCKVSSQTISGAKSRAFFSPNIDQDNKEALRTIRGF